MWIQQNYAKFDSRVQEESLEMWFNSYAQYDQGMAYYWSWMWDSVYFIGNLLSEIIPFFIVLFAAFYLIYLLITAIKHWLDEVLKDLQKRGNWFISSISRLWNWIVSWKLRHVFKAWWANALFWVIIFVLLSTISSIFKGQSRLVKIDRIAEWMVWIDLQHNKVIQPWYHVYSPLMSSYFLSPTNTFDFEIAEATANTSEELNVVIDRRVGFEFQDGKRLWFYNQYWAKNIRLISSDIVMPLLLESIKSVIYRYSFKDLSAKSEEIKQATLELANEKLSDKWIALQYLNIIDIRLPESYLKSQEDLLKAENEGKLAEAALETQKKLAEKEFLKAENLKAIKIVEAEAIAEYNRIVSEQSLTTQWIEMKKLELNDKKIQKWNGILPTTVEGGFDF